MFELLLVREYALADLTTSSAKALYELGVQYGRGGQDVTGSSGLRALRNEAW